MSHSLERSGAIIQNDTQHRGNDYITFYTLSLHFLSAD
jgi:hypothetical protein